MTATSHDPRQTTIARAEAEALALQEAEELSAERFERVRLQLAANDDDATRSSEFRDWMEARHRTDEAWGRWAVAMDAVHG